MQARVRLPLDMCTVPAAGCLLTVPSSSPSLPHPSSTPARPPTCSVDAAGFDPALLLSPLSDFPSLGCDTPESPDSLASGSDAVVRRCSAVPDECAPCCVPCCVRMWGAECTAAAVPASCCARRSVLRFRAALHC